MADKAQIHRINAGKQVVTRQMEFFQSQFGQVASSWKPDDTRVTFADFAISERIFAALREDFPKDQFCSEEANPADERMDTARGYSWVLDPIDGTNNFALGMPICAISLALLRDGEPIYGFIYDYCGKRLLHGGAGAGVWDGHRRLKPQHRPFEARSSVVAMHFPLEPGQSAALQPLLTTYRIRSMGSGTMNLAWVALGILDGAVDFKVKVWDIAAAYALLQGAESEIHFLGGHPFPMHTFHVEAPYLQYCAGSPEFCREVLSLVR